MSDYLHLKNKKNSAMPLPFFLRTRLRIAAFIILPLLSACVAQKTFKEGQELAQQGQVEAGLQKMQEASKLDPNDVEFKTTYFRTRDAAISGYLEEADRDIVAGRRLDAENLFRRVLAMDVANVRALDGLKHVGIEDRHDKLLADASQQFQSGGYDAARLKLSVILTENPDNEKAQVLQRNIVEKTTRSGVGDKLAAMYKKPITLQFRDASLKQIFEIISQSSGLNFVFDKDVKTDQRTSIFLKDSTIESAVYYTLLTNQLDQQVMDGNTILIYPNSVAKQKDYQAMIVKSFYLTNADAKAVAATLKSIIKARDVVVDEKLNMLIMRDSPEAIKLAEKLIALHDIAEPEVMLDVAVLEVKRTKLQDLGIQWPNGLTLTPIAPSGVNAIPNGGLALNQLLHIPASNVGVGNPSAQVNAHSTDSDANLLANPRIRTRNHEKAKIMIGDRVPNITVNTQPSAATFISETITYVDVGLKLEVEPTVYLDNDVAIKISLEVSNIVSQLVTKSGSVAYQIGTRNASSVLRLRDGETQVLAGLLDDEERHTINKIPSLGDIPILGHLFGSTNDDLQKTEIILSITPHLIRNIRRPDVTAAQFESGTENNLKPRPESGDFISSSNSISSTGTKSTTPKRKTAQLKPAVDRDVSGSAAAPLGAVVNESTMPAQAPLPAPAPVNDENEGNVDGAPADPGSRGGPVVFGWVGPTGVPLGGNIILRITAKSDEALSSLPVTVGFDSNVFTVTSVTEGDFLAQGGGQAKFSSQVDPKGQILISASSSGATSGASGVLASISLRAIGPTDGSAVQVLSATPINASGRVVEAKISADTTINVSK